MWVYIPYTSYDYTQMQWPAPSDYHVPLKDEWVALCGILTNTFWLAGNATTMGTYLKMPMAWYRVYGNANVNSEGSEGRYWSSSPFSGYYAYFLRFTSGIYPQNSDSQGYGFSVRCFKNTPVVPTSSWTTLYQGSWNAWVFWNSTDWLISVSWDGVTWYTIQDKNLWATTVYNQWDTLTDANCGYFYQWGNNYWFPHSWSVTTSSTRVDASNYWPWNYYSSSTFITRNYWSSVQNDNLWGATTGVKPMSELKNAYIGEYRVPSSTTEIYYDFNGDINDKTGKWNNATVSWTITYWTLSTGKVYGITTQNSYISFPLLPYSSPFTIVIWYQITWYTTWGQVYTIMWSNIISRIMVYNPYNTGFYWCETDKPSYASQNFWLNRIDWNWHCFGMAFSTSSIDYYLDWNRIWGSSGWSWSDTSVESSIWNNLDIYMWAFIKDLKTWSLQDYQDYYNLTKSNYWL